MTADPLPFPTAETGMTAVSEASDGWARACVDDLIRKLAATGRPWSMNDARSYLPDVRPALLGARVNAAARSGLIRDTGGRVPSSLRSTHKKPLTVWRGAP